MRDVKPIPILFFEPHVSNNLVQLVNEVETCEKVKIDVDIQT